MVHFNRVDISEGIGVNETSESREYVIFVNLGNFYIKCLKFNQMYGMNFIINYWSMNLSGIAILNINGGYYLQS